MAFDQVLLNRMTIWYNEYRISCRVLAPSWTLNCSVLNPHQFDANPDPNFHVIADPDPDPNWHQNDADSRADPSQVSHMLENIIF